MNIMLKNILAFAKGQCLCLDVTLPVQEFVPILEKKKKFGQIKL